ncbi:MAG TPA: hypothetical protein VFP84_21575 [Kofleriaceae bacterium]|nr:hypothetical protein [Kofleriaceae bacterium]
MSWLRGYLGNAATFLPAIAFMLYVRLGPGALDARWAAAYELGGALAIAHAIWLWRTRQRFAIALGIDLYLAIGGALAVASSSANTVWGAELGAAAALACVLAVSLVGVLVSPAGFNDVADLEPAPARRLARAMLVATAAALALAAAFRHRMIAGGVVPIVGLVIASRVLRARARSPR